MLAATVALLAAGASPAAAHPLGNFTVNRYDGLVVGEGELRVDHVEDLAEIPTARIRPEARSEGELAAWAKTRCETAAREPRVRVDGRAVAVRTGAARAEIRPGQAGLPTLRVECRMSAPLPDRGATVDFRAGTGGPGWREITARGDRTTLTSSDVPRDTVSRRLSTYPDGLLDSPPDRTTATLTVLPGGPALAEDAATAAPPSVLPRGVDRWTQALTGLVERRELTLSFGALALAIAVGLGALHALAPGHGKTLMAAAAAAGGRSSLRDVLALGASVTVTHTLGVFALGAVVTAGAAVGPSVVGWLGMASGALVTVAGALLVRRAWHHRAHEHGHGHTHIHWPGTGHAHSHDHTHARPDDTPVPAHDHGHGHGQEHGHGHGHGHGQEHPHPHPHRQGTAPTRSRPLRRTVLLGFAGGLVPSPSAVVVLVGAAALGHAWFGLLLVVAYGAGLALTLTAAGFAVVRLGARAAGWLARRRAGGRPAGRFIGFLHRTAPLSTAVAVFVLGCGLLFRGAAGAIS
ncbi:sulfite exporter TauE/SafE family protein [Streptomyces sp. NPDC059909]|uniref:HoxN/HupN/NixA family nickel/cobalt transporter n=1 Tax=Streptomyces sp. NPDC059909 TaxID=3346998 RepID=UPI0036523B44